MADTEDPTFRRAVVTGGAGFVGAHLCEALLATGTAVVCVDDFLTGRASNVAHLLRSDRFRLVGADVTEGLDVDGDVDAVFHLACPASPVDYARYPIDTLRVGSLGTAQALELARRKDARFVLTSTSEVYGDPLVHPQPESYWGNVNPVGPRSVYDEAKRFSEALTTAYRIHQGVDTAIARIFNTYGPRMRADDGRAVPTFVCQALRGEPLTVAGDGSQTRSICYVSDTVEGLLALARSGHSGPMNIGNPQEMSVLELARRIAELCDSPSEPVYVGRPVDDPTTRCPDITLARAELGWKPQIDWREGLARTVDWFARRIESAAPNAA